MLAGATIAMLSYGPENADAELTAAAKLLTGSFRTSYEDLVKTMVIAGSKQKQVSANATVSAAAPEPATANSAAVLVFVDQTITFGTDAPTNTSSVVEVSLAKIDGKWLVSGFDPK
jgi:Mce-associated membrane protein